MTHHKLTSHLIVIVNDEYCRLSKSFGLLDFEIIYNNTINICNEFTDV